MENNNTVKAPENFQQAMDELKSIVKALENNESDLDKSIELFKRGSFLSKWAEDYLQTMEEEIVKITGEFDLSEE